MSSARSFRSMETMTISHADTNSLPRLAGLVREAGARPQKPSAVPPNSPKPKPDTPTPHQVQTPSPAHPTHESPRRSIRANKSSTSTAGARQTAAPPLLAIRPHSKSRSQSPRGPAPSQPPLPSLHTAPSTTHSARPAIARSQSAFAPTADAMPAPTAETDRSPESFQRSAMSDPKPGVRRRPIDRPHRNTPPDPAENLS